MMLWRVLGPLEVQAGESWIGVDAPKRRGLLAALLAEPGRVVSTGRLIDELWGDNPPAAARQMVSGYVLRLRRLIGDTAGWVLVTQAPGYRLAITAAEVDAGRFEELLAAGRLALAEDDAGRAAGLLAEALGLWRGPALADVPRGTLAAAEADRLEELRLAAAELQADAGLRLGRAAELVPRLRWLTAAQPLRERFWYQLIRALEECGRPAEALAAYAHAREVIADELGADPGPELQQLHRRLLAGDRPPSTLPPDSCERPAAVHVPSTAAPVVPHQLPGAVLHFVGRAEELQRLSGVLETVSGAAGTVVISVIGGTAGVGKTALAVHWAHQAAGKFPDGQLYVNLRGYDPGQPMSPADALAAFLNALGVPGTDIPAGTDERAAHYRSLLAGRRMLILLDNARSAEQVRPLLPASPTCRVLVTSRDALPGLVAREGAQRLDLDLLSPGDAVTLLTTLIGERAATDSAATAMLAGQCARLPLALRVAAELAVTHPSTSLAELTGELAGHQKRLDLLDAGGDPRTAVRAVFSWSYRYLDARTAQTFRLLSLHPGPDLDSYAAAALTTTAVEHAVQALDRLTRAHLIQPAPPGRYSMHDLLRAYARELAARQDGQDECRAALTRLFDYYLHTATAAMDTLFPAERHHRPRVAAPPATTPPVTRQAGAQAWLDEERASLAAVAAHGADAGWPGHTTRLAATLYSYLDNGGHHPDAMALATFARRAACHMGDQTAEADSLFGLGRVDWNQDRCQQARDNFQRALTLYQKNGNQTGQARALAGLGLVHLTQGQYEQAGRRFQQALALYQETGNWFGEARALSNLGAIEARQGRYQQAADYQQQALTLSRLTGDQPGEATVLTRLGIVELRQGLYQQAADHQQQALALSRQTGDRGDAADALRGLGATLLRQDHYQQAADHYRQALALYRQLGARSGQAAALNGLGEALLASGRPAEARVQLAAALDLATQAGDQYREAGAHDRLGRASYTLGAPVQARRHWQQALALYTGLGTPEADQIRTQLASLQPQPPPPRPSQRQIE